MGRKAIDLTGQRFGRLTVLERAPTPLYVANRHSWWKCQCDCGEELQTCSHYLKKGTTKSCGCLREELATTMWENRREKKQ